MMNLNDEHVEAIEVTLSTQEVLKKFKFTFLTFTVTKITVQLRNNKRVTESVRGVLRCSLH